MANEAPKQGTFCWNELMTRDVERATKFYTDLIGWTAA
jgi:predicted enzyme related to lactoylglutathione lyase